MLELEIEGVEEVEIALRSAVVILQGDWHEGLERAGEQLQRIAVGFSPVVTGSYAGAHQLTIGDKHLSLAIDHAARNTVTGTRVIEYAGSVEERHAVYTKTARQMNRIAVAVEESFDGLFEA